jgi:hypothetical protein
MKMEQSDWFPEWSESCNLDWLNTDPIVFYIKILFSAIIINILLTEFVQSITSRDFIYFHKFSFKNVKVYSLFDGFDIIYISVINGMINTKFFDHFMLKTKDSFLFYSQWLYLFTRISNRKLQHAIDFYVVKVIFLPLIQKQFQR